MNILSAIKDQLSPELVQQVSGRLGETPEATKSAMDSSLQALLGSAAAQASSPAGANSLFNLLKDKAPQGGWPTSAGSLLGSLTGDSQGLGSALVTTLMGSKLNAIRDFISNRSGIRSESASSLLTTVGTFLMGFLGRHVASQGLGASSFGQLLRSQSSHLQNVVSPDLAGMLGIGNLLGSAKTDGAPAAYASDAGATQHAEPVSAGAPSASRILRFAWIPLLLLGGILFLAHHFRTTNSVGGTSDDTYSTRSGSTGTVISAATGYVRDGANNFADRLKSAISTPTSRPLDIPGLTFDPSGTIAAGSEATLSSVANVINDNPATKVKFTVYGQTAQQAANRASSLGAALVKAGLSEERFTIQSEVGEATPKISFIK